MNCDIVVNDSTDVISRRHALLNITPSGKMTIIDQSSNGTYVNGIRITQNVPVPVTRKDIVSLAHVAKLDWDQVPKSNEWMKYLAAAVVAVIIILGIVFGVKHLNTGSEGNSDSNQETTTVDSAAIKQKEAERQDTVKKTNQVQKDSIDKQGNNNEGSSGHRTSTTNTTTAPTPTQKNNKQPQKEESKKDTVEVITRIVG